MVRARRLGMESGTMMRRRRLTSMIVSTTWLRGKYSLPPIS